MLLGRRYRNNLRPGERDAPSCVRPSPGPVGFGAAPSGKARCVRRLAAFMRYKDRPPNAAFPLPSIFPSRTSSQLPLWSASPGPVSRLLARPSTHTRKPGHPAATVASTSNADLDREASHRDRDRWCFCCTVSAVFLHCRILPHGCFLTRVRPSTLQLQHQHFSAPQRVRCCAPLRFTSHSGPLDMAACCHLLCDRRGDDEGASPSGAFSRRRPIE